MMSLTADWRRQNAIVIGYPATKGLIRFYVEPGARRDYPRGQGNGNAAWPSTPRHQRNGQVEPDQPHLYTLEPSRRASGPGRGVGWPAVASRGIESTSVNVTVETGFVTVGLG